MLGAHCDPQAATLHNVEEEPGDRQAILARQHKAGTDKPARRADSGRVVGRTFILMHGAGRLDPQQGAFGRTHPYSLTACTVFSSCILSNDH
jgi:hypothetical protein